MLQLGDAGPRLAKLHGQLVFIHTEALKFDNAECLVSHQLSSVAGAALVFRLLRTGDGGVLDGVRHAHLLLALAHSTLQSLRPVHSGVALLTEFCDVVSAFLPGLDGVGPGGVALGQ